MDDKIREAWKVARSFALAAQPPNVAQAYPAIQAIQVLDEHFNAEVVPFAVDEDAQTG